MNLYSYQYLTHQSGILSDVFIGLGIIAVLIILFAGLKYIRDRNDLKYRDLLITFSLFAILIISLQIGRFQTQKSNRSQTNQTATVMRSVSQKKRIPLSKIYTNSTNINNGMIIKAGSHYYQVNSNNNLSSYSLEPTHPLTTQVHYVQRKHFSFRLQNLDNDQYLGIALKLLMGFVMLVVQINLSGKGNLAPSNAIDQVQNYVLGGIVGGMIYNQAITILQFFIVLLIWSIIIFGSRTLINQSDFFKNLLNGKPHSIIKDGHINVNSALRSGISASNLAFKLRSEGIHNYQEVKSAILEQNGQLTINSYGRQPANYPIITDGKANEDILKVMHHNQAWLNKILKLKHQKIDNVYLGQFIGDQLILVNYPRHKRNLFSFHPNIKINLKR